jgi:hypothetical protein
MTCRQKPPSSDSVPITVRLQTGVGSLWLRFQAEACELHDSDLACPAAVRKVSCGEVNPLPYPDKARVADLLRRGLSAARFFSPFGGTAGRLTLPA